MNREDQKIISGKIVAGVIAGQAADLLLRM